MASLKEEAEFQRLALAMALTDVSAVVAWADCMIIALQEPPIQVIDVALAGSRPADEVVDLLANVPGKGDLTAVAHQVLGQFLQRFRAGVIPLELAVEMLWAYHNWASVPEDEWLQAGNLREMLFCAQEGYYGSLESVREEIVAFVVRYAGEEAPA